jgi:hypothetical protein
MLRFGTMTNIVNGKKHIFGKFILGKRDPYVMSVFLLTETQSTIRLFKENSAVV